MSKFISIDDRDWFFHTMEEYANVRASIPIVDWVNEGNVMLPSNTSEPGVYSLARTPYQEGMIQTMSPESPVQEVILCTGSQVGKTTIEQVAMGYYIKEEPSPMGFVFSDDGNLKTFLKFKFDPFMTANPNIKTCFKSSGRSQADSLSSKQFAGGYLKFLSGKSESSMRSDSMRIVFLDEVDGMGRTKGGDVRALMRKRTNTFGSSRKLILSSTPLDEGVIYDYLEESTYNKYFIKCPECGEHFVLEWDNFRWELEEDKDAIVKDAWFECPRCKHVLHNEDKLTLLSPKYGAEWRPTNKNADPKIQGFYLPSFYAPVGWLSWKDIAEEYATAALKSSGIDHEKVRTFYNTILALPYRQGGEALDWRDRYYKAEHEDYVRGSIPEWVEVITTSSDVQLDRFETQVMGWGMNGKHIEIDYYVIEIPENDGIEIVNSYAWRTYTEMVLDRIYVRDDGLKMKTALNCMDSSYKQECVYTFYQYLDPATKTRFFPIKGSDRSYGDKNYMPNKRFVKDENFTNVCYYLIPASNLKYKVYEDLSLSKTEDEPFYPIHPQGYDEEHFQQLFAEEIVITKGRVKWVKKRARNEVLDLTVYNYGMYFLGGYSTLSTDDWKEIARIHKDQLMIQDKPKQTYYTNRMISQGFVE